MIEADTIRAIAADKGIHPGIIEKDYALSKVLQALARIDSYNQHLLFKGGTAIKKFYYPEWRFSEDLDFTSRDQLNPKDIQSIFKQAVDQVGKLFGLGMRIIEYSQYPRSGDDIVSAQLKLGYDGPLRKSSGQKNNVRVDIAFEEIILTEPVTRELLPGYSDDIETQLKLYSLEEIISEKLRSILQRGKSRDYYDVWVLLKQYKSDFSNDSIWGILKKKCEFKGISAPVTADFMNPERAEEARRYWERGLAHQLSDLPDFDTVLEELRGLLDKTLK